MMTDKEKQRRPPGSRGFTLIELIVVVTIIGILAGIAVVNVRNAQRKAQENVLRHDLATMRKAIDDFYADRQKFPASLEELVTEKYMRKIPVDPITKSAETWTTEAEEADDLAEDESVEGEDSFSTGPGIIDVRSGAEGTTMDGTPYVEL